MCINAFETHGNTGTDKLQTETTMNKQKLGLLHVTTQEFTASLNVVSFWGRFACAGDSCMCIRTCETHGNTGTDRLQAETTMNKRLLGLLHVMTQEFIASLNAVRSWGHFACANDPCMCICACETGLLHTTTWETTDCKQKQQ